MISTLVALLGGWRAAVFAAALFIVGSYAGVQTFRLAGARADLAEAKAAIAEASAATQAAARTESERRDAASSGATQTMLDYLGHNLPAIEATSYAATERVRTIYRDRPVAALCVRPDGVRAELDAARARANAAPAGGLPADAAGAGAADTGARADGRVGARGDVDHRGGTLEMDRRAGLPFFAQVAWRHPLSAP